jgi:hypothetical protein
MPEDILTSLRQLSDGELVARVNDLAARERGATALLVAHLAELDTRDVHLRAGYGSLFAYCRTALALSEAEAYNCVEAARGARRFPVILEQLAEGSVNLTAVRLLVPHLTEANHREVLDAARGKGRADVEGIVARLSPRPASASCPRRRWRLRCSPPLRFPPRPSRFPPSASSRWPSQGIPARPWPRSHRTGTGFSSRSASRRSRSCGSPGTCCATRFPPGTRPRSWTAL